MERQRNGTEQEVVLNYSDLQLKPQPFSREYLRSHPFLKQGVGVFVHSQNNLQKQCDSRRECGFGGGSSLAMGNAQRATHLQAISHQHSDWLRIEFLRPH
jgi:hypothetical protein